MLYPQCNNPSICCLSSYTATLDIAIKITIEKYLNEKKNQCFRDLIQLKMIVVKTSCSCNNNYMNRIGVARYNRKPDPFFNEYSIQHLLFAKSRSCVHMLVYFILFFILTDWAQQSSEKILFMFRGPACFMQYMHILLLYVTHTLIIVVILN